MKSPDTLGGKAKRVQERLVHTLCGPVKFLLRDPQLLFLHLRRIEFTGIFNNRIVTAAADLLKNVRHCPAAVGTGRHKTITQSFQGIFPLLVCITYNTYLHHYSVGSRLISACKELNLITPLTIQQPMIKSILLLLVALLCLPSSVFCAAPEKTDRCHCFRDRDYDPANRFAADDYLMTTSFNSLVAATLDISKRQIVMLKMQGGVDSREFLIGRYLAFQSGMPLDDLLDMRNHGANWQKILHSLKNMPEKNNAVLSAIEKGAPDTKIADLISDDLLSRRYHAQAAELKKLRRQNLSSKEINVILALHNLTPLPINRLVELYRSGGKSWSEIAATFNLSPAAVGKFILNKPS